MVSNAVSGRLQEWRYCLARVLLLGALAAIPLVASPTMAQTNLSGHTFTVDGDHFEFDGKPTPIVAGELHYARIPREYWRARLKMARAMGLNTIATYVFWNVHEPRPGIYDFSGNYDLAAFLRIAQEEGLHVLLRAGPYSCAEWEFGGFPAWLLKDPARGAALRTDDPAFMVPAERWIRRLAQETFPLLLANGGPIIAIQVENEYGNFGGDKEDKQYMEHMLHIFQSSAWSGALFYTVDPSKALARGNIDGVLSGVNFGTGNAERGLQALSSLRPGQPLFATEYWPGWFDLWGHPHQTRPLAPQLKDLEYVFSHNSSINIYMFHGGTSFGMMAGASASTGNYRGNVTSYDYDAPLDEAGHPTPKFFAYRDLILKYTHEAPPPVPPMSPVIAIPEFTLSSASSLWDHLPQPIQSEMPLFMEQVDQSYGYILYRKQLDEPLAGEVLTLDPVHDFALIYLDGKLAGTLDRHYNQTSLTLATVKPARLDILIENTGRLNSTRQMRYESKGTHQVTLGGKALTGWQIYSLPMDSPIVYQPTPGAAADPHFTTGTFRLDAVGDTYLDVSSLGKGLVWINGHALGRFWNIGPQNTLYVPGPWLQRGENKVVIFDVFAASSPNKLVGRLSPILDGPTPAYAADPEVKMKADPKGEFGPKLTSPSLPRSQ